MQIFLDSANPEEIKAAIRLGWVDGVTTNPSLVADVGWPYGELIKEILSVCQGPVSLEVVATDITGMLDQAKRLAAFGRQVVVKLPCTSEGLSVAAELTQQKIKTNITLIFNLSQAILAAKVGATYCSPFVGRLDDVIEHQGEELLSHIRTTYDEQKFTTKLVAASIRDVAHFEEAVTIGADAVTVHYHVLEKLSKHPLTDQGLQKFLDQWNRSHLEFPAQ